MSPQEFWNNQAFDEGWALMDCKGSRWGDWQIQRMDEPENNYCRPIFATDDDAVAFVAEKAAAGSEYHQQALAIHTAARLTCNSRFRGSSSIL